MELYSDDILIKLFEPEDGSDAVAVKVKHRTSRSEATNAETPSQLENLRRALRDLVAKENPNPKLIKPSTFLLFDHVKVFMPESIHLGEINRQAWDFKTSQWRYYVDCHSDHVNGWYHSADLDLDEPTDEDDD